MKKLWAHIRCNLHCGWHLHGKLVGQTNWVTDLIACSDCNRVFYEKDVPLSNRVPRRHATPEILDSGMSFRQCYMTEEDGTKRPIFAVCHYPICGFVDDVAAAEIDRLRKALTTIQENYTKRGMIKRICSQALGNAIGGETES